MLQSNLLQTESPRAPLSDVANSDQTEGGIGDIVNFALGFVRRRYLVIIVATVLAMAACVVYLRITPPTYTARV
jgi:polysaccharide biosynthesis transport protein